MNRNAKQSVQNLLQKFFLQRMMQQRNLSSQTICSYRDTFRIFLKYLVNFHKIPISKVDMSHFDRYYLLGFLAYLEEKRINKITTINNRLAAIRSFLIFVLEEAPEYSAIAKKGLAMPFQKHDIPVLDFITKDEFESLLLACKIGTAIGNRDKLMLLMLYNTGVRVSELIRISCKDIIEGPRTCVKVMGKGRKERLLPLWKTTSLYLQKYTKDTGLHDQDAIFRGRNGDNLTRSGVRFRIDKLVGIASQSSKTLLEKHISAHTFRHSVAMNLLTSGVNISSIAIWLGHESIETTHKYMVANIEMKRKALELLDVPVNTSYRYKPSQDILSFLSSL